MAAPAFLVDGNRLVLLEEGPARLAALIALIEGVRRSLRLLYYILYYIYADDAAGRRVNAALLAAAARGVRVALIVDGFGSDAAADEGSSRHCRRGGVAVCRFVPRFGRRYLLRNHQKLALADGEEALGAGGTRRHAGRPADRQRRGLFHPPPADAAPETSDLHARHSVLSGRYTRSEDARSVKSLPLLALLLATAIPAPLLAQAAPTVAAPLPGDGPEDARLKALFAASDEANLKRNPLAALFRGDLRYADQLGEFLTDRKTALEKQAREDDLAALARIDRAKLTPVDQIAYDVFKNEKEVELRGFAPDLMRVGRLLPMDHFSGFQTFYPDIASGGGAAPFKTVADYENNLKRNAQYAVVLDRAIDLFREGLKANITQPKLVVENMIGQFDNLIKQGVEGSVFYGPVKKFPDSFSAADKVRLTQAYTTQIRDVLIPAHTRLRDFLKTEYLPHARTSIGISALPDGDKLYAYAILSNTTLPLTADYVHQLGLSEVARILKEMEAQKAAVGFKGTLAEFFTYLRTDPRFQPKTAEQVRLGYEEIGRRVDARVREQFSLIPRTRLEIRPVPAFREKTDAAGSYNAGTPDGSRPGVFFYNTYDLPNRYLWGMETLYLHEAIPGHHFQISLAQENAALPNFIRFGGNTAYVEGWALYAETLWKDLGVETDPYQRMGGLNDEMLRAMRLVVDSGIHAKGWTRDRAIKYMTDNSPMPFSDATAEVERYIAIPGQALAYKIGQLTFLKLKADAKARLGATYDPRALHAQFLDTGALPMPVLEKKIGDWITAQRGK